MWRSQELSLRGAPVRIFFIIILIKENPFVSSTKQLWLGVGWCGGYNELNASFLKIVWAEKNIMSIFILKAKHKAHICCTV